MKTHSILQAAPGSTLISSPITHYHQSMAPSIEQGLPLMAIRLMLETSFVGEELLQVRRMVERWLADVLPTSHKSSRCFLSVQYCEQGLNYCYATATLVSHRYPHQHEASSQRSGIERVHSHTLLASAVRHPLNPSRPKYLLFL